MADGLQTTVEGWLLYNEQFPSFFQNGLLALNCIIGQSASTRTVIMWQKKVMANRLGQLQLNFDDSTPFGTMKLCSETAVVQATEGYY